MKGDHRAGEHSSRQIDGREEAATARMAVDVDFGLACARQEIEPVSERRHVTLRPRRRFVIEQGGEARERCGRSDVFRRFRATDPAAQAIYIHGQNDFGRPRTWVATCERMRLVEIGAT